MIKFHRTRFLTQTAFISTVQHRKRGVVICSASLDACARQCEKEREDITVMGLGGQGGSASGVWSPGL